MTKREWGRITGGDLIFQDKVSNVKIPPRSCKATGGSLAPPHPSPTLFLLRLAVARAGNSKLGGLTRKLTVGLLGRSYPHTSVLDGAKRTWLGGSSSSGRRESDPAVSGFSAPVPRSAIPAPFRHANASSGGKEAKRLLRGTRFGVGSTRFGGGDGALPLLCGKV